MLTNINFPFKLPVHVETNFPEYLSEEIVTKLAQNPFIERISYLAANPELATQEVKNLKGISSMPNCLGTALFVSGVSHLGYPYHAYDDELEQHMKRKRKTNAEIPGAFVVSYNPKKDDWHAGIYVGWFAGRSLAFAQHGHGGPFCLESLTMSFSDPKFYIPETLLH